MLTLFVVSQDDALNVGATAIVTVTKVALTQLASSSAAALPATSIPATRTHGGPEHDASCSSHTPDVAPACDTSFACAIPVPVSPITPITATPAPLELPASDTPKDDYAVDDDDVVMSDFAPATAQLTASLGSTSLTIPGTPPRTATQTPTPKPRAHPVVAIPPQSTSLTIPGTPPRTATQTSTPKPRARPVAAIPPQERPYSKELSPNPKSAHSSGKASPSQPYQRVSVALP